MWALQYDGDVGWGFVPAADQAAGFDAFPHFLKDSLPELSLADSKDWRITHCLLHHFDAGNIHDSDLALIDFLETALNLSPLPLDGARVLATHGQCWVVWIAAPDARHVLPLLHEHSGLPGWKV